MPPQVLSVKPLRTDLESVMRGIRVKRIRRLASAIAMVVLAWAIAVQPQVVSAAEVQTLAATVTGSGAVTVTWAVPSGATSGDYSYTLYYRAGSSGGFTTASVSAGQESKVLSGLTGGQSYEIRVTATPVSGVNSGQEGCDITGEDCSDTVLNVGAISVTAATTPSAPTVSSVAAGNGQIIVDFSAGATNGSTISNFTATCGSRSQTGISSPITVTSLTNGVATTCTVTTGSNVGDSSASAASSSVTPSTTPDQMAAPSVSARDASVVVSWTSVIATTDSGVSDTTIDDGGNAVTGYEISITDATTNSEVTTETASASDSTITITGLSNGTAYKSRVRASNGNGPNSYSEYSASFTPVSDDVNPPTITVGRSGSGTLRAGGTASLTFVLSESSTSFVAGDVTVSGGTLTGFAGSGANYTATFTLTATGTSTASVSVAAGVFTDAAGNTNTASDSLSIAYDTVAPTITVGRSGSGTLRAGQTASLTFVLSESATNFDDGDVTVSGGTLTGFAGSGANYTATFTLTATGTSTASVSVAGGVFTDAAGNNNTASNSLSIAYDTVVPTTTTEAPAPSDDTVPTPSTVPSTVPTTTVPPQVPTTTIPTIVVSPQLGTKVMDLPQVPSRIAEETAIALRKGMLTVLIDPPNLPKVRAVGNYVITLTPIGGGRPVVRVVKVNANGQVLMSKFTGLKGGYRVTITARNQKGSQLGTWKSPRINVRG